MGSLTGAVALTKYQSVTTLKREDDIWELCQKWHIENRRKTSCVIKKIKYLDLYAGTSEHIRLPKCENIGLRTISRESLSGALND